MEAPPGAGTGKALVKRSVAFDPWAYRGLAGKADGRPVESALGSFPFDTMTAITTFPSKIADFLSTIGAGLPIRSGILEVRV